jgi:programmed cell death 6-interacting protein
MQTKLTTDDAIIEEAAALEATGPVAPADFEDYFSRRLDSHYSGNRDEYRLDQTESSKLRARLREANTSFVKSRKSDTSLEERERALQKLETGYLKFLEIAQNLDEGRKFYNELARMLGRWMEGIRGFVYQRKKEVRDLEGYFTLILVLISRDLNVEMSKLKLSDPKVTNNTAEKRTSQRATRSTSRQLKEVNVENDPESKTTDGHRSPGMWTPGMHTSPS